MSNPYGQGGPQPSDYSQPPAGDPFNTPPPALAYDGQPGAPGPGGQYSFYNDNESDMGARYEGGGMARDTWASESGWSGNGGEYRPDTRRILTCRPKLPRVRAVTLRPAGVSLPRIHSHLH